MTVPLVEINSDHHATAFPFRRGQLSISPSGTYRALVEARADTGFDRVYLSSDGGQTWTTIGDAPGTNGSLAVWDDGTVHYAVEYFASGTTKVTYFTYAGSWSAGVVVWNTNAAAVTILTDGTNLVVYGDIASAAYPWRSTDGGATWTQGADGTAYRAAERNACWVGDYLFFREQGVSRYRWSTDTWDGPIGGLSGDVRLLNVPGSTTEFYLVQLTVVSGVWSIGLSHSTDSGATWTSVGGDSVPSGMGSLLHGGVTMGADGLLHLFGFTGTNDFVTCTRDLAASGTYGPVLLVAPAPSGSGLVPPVDGGSQAFPMVRYDGGVDNDIECYTQIDVTAGDDTVTEVVALVGLSPLGGWSVGTIKIGG